jgi:hypothetical protein
LALDGKNGDGQITNLKFMSPEFLELLGYAAAKCKQLGLRMDLTLGSGWPYGGPMFPADEGAGALETAAVQVMAGAKTAEVPQLRPGRKVITAFAGPAIAGGGGGGRGGRGRGGPSNADVSGFKEVSVENGVATLPADFAGGEVVFFISGRTGMQVKRPAVGAEGNVIDHLSSSVVDKFIREIGEPEIKACGANPPYAIFCDSLEVQGENWTDDFLAEFQKRRGYDLKPFLPALMGNIGARTEDIRHDFAQTVTDVYNDNFNEKFKDLARKYNTRFRVQGYGSPPAGLVSYAYSDLPEGEGGGNGNWRTFRTTRYAASASHLLGQKVTSSETFTWLHGAPFRATPLDIKGEVDTHFLDGINQMICHGWPYTGSGANYPGWSFYAAAVFDDKNPWYIAMPDVTGYITRVSHLMREGRPANDVALYLPDADVFARAGLGYSSLNASHTQLSGMVAELLGAGYNLDGWDDGMLALKGKVEGGALAFGEQKYKVVVLDGVTHMPLATAQKLEEFVKGGGILIAVESAPSKVPGYKATEADQEALKGIMQRLFKDAGAKGILVNSEREVGPALAKKLAPDVAVEPANPAIGAVHRHTDGGEVYFVANTGNQKQTVKATFRVEGMQPEMWDPMTGKVHPLAIAGKSAAGTTVSLDLEPLGSTVVVFTNRTLPAVAAAAPSSVDLSGGWSVKIGEKTVPMEQLVSWTELPDMQNFSGVAHYTRTVDVPAAMIKPGESLYVTFGEGKAPAGGGGGRTQGYAAALESPVRDAAVVMVNGKRAGAAWAPPFRVDVTGLLKPGQNTLQIDVGNTAVNYLAKAGFPNYDNAAVRAKYGARFDPQGVQLLSTPLPSGLLGPVKLESQ